MFCLTKVFHVEKFPMWIVCTVHTFCHIWKSFVLFQFSILFLLHYFYFCIVFFVCKSPPNSCWYKFLAFGPPFACSLCPTKLALVHKHCTKFAFVYNLWPSKLFPCDCNFSLNLWKHYSFISRFLTKKKKLGHWIIHIFVFVSPEPFSRQKLLIAEWQN